MQVVISGVVYDIEVEDTGEDSAQPAAPEGIQSMVLPVPGSGSLAGRRRQDLLQSGRGIGGPRKPGDPHM